MDRSGELFDHYRIVRKLGAGGMGEVYHAHDEQLDREVAIKLLPAASLDDANARSRLIREARAAAALNHPNVCTIFEIGEANGQAYIAMELVEGPTLAAVLAAGPLPIDRVVGYAQQLGDALAHAHTRGVIHRDLKSANIIVTADGRIKVLDFGLAKRANRGDVDAAVTHATVMTEVGAVMGTLAYMAPEQLRGQLAQPQSDVWALGIVLCEMASGERPFAGRTGYELSAAILDYTPVSLPSGVPAGLRAVMARCLEKNPARRYRDGSDVCTALEALAASGGLDDASAPTRTAPPATDRPTFVVALPRRRVLAVAAATIVTIVSAVALWRAWGPNPDVRSLAVLPLQNPQNDQELEYLCDGIADSLTRQISRLPALRVRNFATVLQLKGRSADAQAAGRQLEVDSVLTGALQRDGPRLLITAQLVDVASGRALWHHRYDLDATDLLDTQDQIASAIVTDGLHVQLTSAQRQQLVRHPTTDGDAYDLYLQARHIQRRATEEDYLHSRALLERAIGRDREFALAYAMLSANYAMMVTDGLERPSVAWPQVNRYARRALEIDPDLPEGYTLSHALAFLFDWDWDGAARARQRLLQYPIGDFDPQVLRSLALEHWALGRHNDALDLARRTRELDPASGYLAILEADYLLRAGQLEAAAALYERASRTEPDNPNVYFGLAEALSRQGRFDEAITARYQAHILAGDDSLDDLFETARGEAGYRQIDRAWAGLQLEMLKERERVGYVSPLDFARAYAQLGEADTAFSYLEAAVDDRSPGLVFLNVDPAWDAVRHDPRFTAIVRKVGLPEPSHQGHPSAPRPPA